MDAIALNQLNALGIRRIRNARQLAGTLSAGERQALAIARALYFGARVLVFDEPTSALGVRESRRVLGLIANARSSGTAIIMVTHNVHQALEIGDSFAVLNRGRLAAAFRRGDRTDAEVLALMGGDDSENQEPR